MFQLDVSAKEYWLIKIINLFVTYLYFLISRQRL